MNNEESLEWSKAVDELRTLVRSEVPEEVDGLPLGRELDRLEEACEVCEVCEDVCEEVKVIESCKSEV